MTEQEKKEHDEAWKEFREKCDYHNRQKAIIEAIMPFFILGFVLVILILKFYLESL